MFYKYYTFVFVIFILICLIIAIKFNELKKDIKNNILNLFQNTNNKIINDKYIYKYIFNIEHFDINLFNDQNYKNIIDNLYYYFPNNFNWRTNDYLILLENNNKFYIPNGIFPLSNYKLSIDKYALINLNNIIFYILQKV